MSESNYNASWFLIFKISRVSYGLFEIYVVLMFTYNIFIQIYYSLEFLQYILALFKHFLFIIVYNQNISIVHFDSSTVHFIYAAIHLISNSILARSMLYHFLATITDSK